MSVSIYYTAKRATPMTMTEKDLIESIIRWCSVDKQIEKYLQTGEGLNWESFTVYDKPSAADIIFEGATKLPDNTKDAEWTGIWRWCSTLSYIRLILHDATWRVVVDNHTIKWNENERRYDPST